MKKLSLALLTALSMCSISPSYAQNNVSCGDRDTIINNLASMYKETRRGIGLGTGNRILEVFASEETGTWTVTVTYANGLMCLIASGQNWEDRMDDLSDKQDTNL